MVPGCVTGRGLRGVSRILLKLYLLTWAIFV